MSIEITGKLVKKLEPKSGVSAAGKQWNKQGFVIQLESKYPKQLQIDVFNNTEMVQFINDTSIDTVLTCNINIESREYQERWYHNVTLWKAEVMREEGNEVIAPPVFNQPPEPEGDVDDLPFSIGESDQPKTKEMLLTPLDTFEEFNKNESFKSLVEEFELEIT